LHEIDWIETVSAGKKLDDFARDRTTRYIVERSIEIIAEASRRIPEELKALRPESTGALLPASAICFATSIIPRRAKSFGMSFRRTWRSSRLLFRQSKPL
jgi:hypothetical protein